VDKSWTTLKDSGEIYCTIFDGWRRIYGSYLGPTLNADRALFLWTLHTSLVSQLYCTIFCRWRRIYGIYLLIEPVYCIHLSCHYYKTRLSIWYIEYDFLNDSEWRSTFFKTISIEPTCDWHSKLNWINCGTLSTSELQRPRSNLKHMRETFGYNKFESCKVASHTFYPNALKIHRHSKAISQSIPLKFRTDSFPAASVPQQPAEYLSGWILRNSIYHLNASSKSLIVGDTFCDPGYDFLLYILFAFRSGGKDNCGRSQY